MKEKKKANTKCIRISEEVHKETLEVVGDKIKIGAYANEALKEKNQKEKQKK